MNENQNNVVPFERFVDKHEEKLGKQQDEIAVDIGKLNKQLEVLYEELRFTEDNLDDEAAERLHNEISALEEQVEKGMERLDELAAEKKKMGEKYRQHEQLEG